MSSRIRVRNGGPDAQATRRVVFFSHVSAGSAPPQALLLTDRLSADGYPAKIVGRGDSGLARGLNTLIGGPAAVLGADTVAVDVFGGRAFLREAVAILYGRAFGRRVVAMLRGGWLPNFVRSWPGLTRWMLRRADLVIAPHAYLAESLAALGVHVDAIIPNIVELGHYRFRVRDQLRPRFLYLRGTHSIYNPEMALRAFGRVQGVHADASLTLATTGPTAELEALAGSLGLRNVKFHGRVPKSAIPALADEHDIYLQSNRVENMPVTVLEMWASGVPVVGTQVGGMSYLVENEINGLLVPSEDEEALAGACLRLLSEPGLGARLAASGRNRVECLTWEHVRELWSEALNLSLPVAASETSASVT